LEKVIVIGGLTASGKTELAIRLAEKKQGEIISADSMQVYRYMDIGTAKPTIEERKGIPHHMIDVVKPDEPFNVAMYKERAQKCIQEVLSRKRLPIVVGGTGLYINSLVYNIQFSETVSDETFRERMKRLAIEKGPEILHEKLRLVDPVSADRIHCNNVKRVIRALEVYEFTKKPISEHQKESTKEPPPFQYLVFILNMDREELYKRIDKRVDIMIEAGLVEEVKSLLRMGYKPGSIALQGLGYKEIIRYLNHEITFDEAIRILKRDTRRYAKRQLTWFRKIDNAIWLKAGGDYTDENIEKIIESL
jgi:tRNA dimethylallyltransferase